MLANEFPNVVRPGDVIIAKRKNNVFDEYVILSSNVSGDMQALFTEDCKFTFDSDPIDVFCGLTSVDVDNEDYISRDFINDEYESFKYLTGKDDGVPVAGKLCYLVDKRGEVQFTTVDSVYPFYDYVILSDMIRDVTYRVGSDVFKQRCFYNQYYAYNLAKAESELHQLDWSIVPERVKYDVGEDVFFIDTYTFTIRKGKVIGVGDDFVSIDPVDTTGLFVFKCADILNYISRKEETMLEALEPAKKRLSLM